jgi:glycerol kinase
MPKLISIDAGTTGVRALAIDADTVQIEAVAYRELPISYPKPGYIEQDAKVMLNLIVECLFEIDNRLDETPIAIGITNQRETIVCWDKSTGQPLSPAIVWQDRRTFEYCQTIKNQGFEDSVRKKTGLYIDPYFSSTKINWLLNNGVSVTSNTVFGTVDTWLIWNLTGGTQGGNFVTEVSNASRTQLLNLETLTWDEDLCNLFDIPLDVLPDITESNGKFGILNCPDMHFLNEVAITGVLGDQQSALFGQSCLNSGDAKATFGTGCFILVNAGKIYSEPPDGLLSTVAWTINVTGSKETTYAFEGSIFSCASTINWTTETLKLFDSPKEIDQRAERISDSGGVFLVPAFNGLGSPQWDPNARGTLIGLGRNTDLNHIARSVLESIVFQTMDVLNTASDNGIDISMLKVDGGVSKSRPLLQMLADYCQINIYRNKSSESTAIGAALMAGLGINYYESLDVITSKDQPDERITPSKVPDGFDQKFIGWHQAVKRSLNWIEQI